MNLLVLDMAQARELLSDAVEIGYSRCIRDRQGKRREDEISQREAYAEFGEAWVKNAVKQGWIKGMRRGTSEKSTKYYSRYEMITLQNIQRLQMAINGSRVEL